MTAVSATHLTVLFSGDLFWKRCGEWFEVGTLIALTALAMIALSIPVVLVVVSIVNVLSWVIGGAW
jgi:hypothetical protein